MPYEMDSSICISLSSWCRLHEYLVFGEYFSRKWIESDSDPPDLSSYSLLVNLHYDVGRHDLTEQMHVLLREKGLKQH
jgi:hypothetical protein